MHAKSPQSPSSFCQLILGKSSLSPRRCYSDTYLTGWPPGSVAMGYSAMVLSQHSLPVHRSECDIEWRAVATEGRQAVSVHGALSPSPRLVGISRVLSGDHHVAGHVTQFLACSAALQNLGCLESGSFRSCACPLSWNKPGRSSMFLKQV